MTLFTTQHIIQSVLNTDRTPKVMQICVFHLIITEIMYKKLMNLWKSRFSGWYRLFIRGQERFPDTLLQEWPVTEQLRIQLLENRPMPITDSDLRAVASVSTMPELHHQFSRHSSSGCLESEIMRQQSERLVIPSITMRRREHKLQPRALCERWILASL